MFERIKRYIHRINHKKMARDCLKDANDPEYVEGMPFMKFDLMAKAGRHYAFVGEEVEAKKCFEEAGKGYEKLGDGHFLIKAAEVYKSAGDSKAVKRVEGKLRILDKEEGLESKIPAVLLIGIIGIGLYFLFNNINVTGNVVTNFAGVSSNFLINFILVGIVGLVCYNYLK